jgi:intermediate filament protein if
MATKTAEKEEKTIERKSSQGSLLDEDASTSSSTTKSSRKVTKTIVTIEDESNTLGESYRPHMQARNIVIQRTGVQYGSMQGSRNSQAMERSMSYAPVGSSAGYQSLKAQGVLDMTTSRHKEKKDLQDLNERLANYIEKTRFLEAMNRRLADELEKLKAKWGKETEMVKAMYEAELAEARRLLDNAVKDKSALEIRLASVDEYMNDLKARLELALKDAAEAKERADRNNQQLSDYEGEIAMLRRRLEALEGDRDKEKSLLKRLQDQLTAARSDLDNETLLHIDAENRRQTLEEELEFLKAVHEQELKELQAMAYRDTTSENREFWKNEMGGALREIQKAYDDKMEGMRSELEGYYNLKVQEVRTGAARTSMVQDHSQQESKRLKTQLGGFRDKLADLESRNLQLSRELEALRREKEERERELEEENVELKSNVAKLRAEMEAMLKELEHIIDTKLGLELEIAAYRKLLEGEESRAGLRQIVDSIITGQEEHSSSSDVSYTVRQSELTSGDSSLKVNQVVKGEMQAKTTYQKSAKGPVAIAECSTEGKFIILDNTGRKDESLAGWKIKRSIDGADKPEFTFGDNALLKNGEKLKIWAKGMKPSDAPASDLEFGEAWGIGGHIITKLVNPTGEDRATHIQKTNYS